MSFLQLITLILLSITVGMLLHVLITDRSTNKAEAKTKAEQEKTRDKVYISIKKLVESGNYFCLTYRSSDEADYHIVEHYDDKVNLITPLIFTYEEWEEKYRQWADSLDGPGLKNYIEAEHAKLAAYRQNTNTTI